MNGFTRRELLASSLLAGLFGGVRPTFASESISLPWRNWSGGQSAQPAGRFAPSTENELIAFLKSTSGPVRPVGSGHSFTPLVPTDGHLIVIDQLAGLLEHDATALRATFGAGSRLGDMGPALAGIDQAMINLPDIDRQTLAGACATATHGTGIEFQSLSGYLTGLRLITPAGDVLDLNAESDSDLLNAARQENAALRSYVRSGVEKDRGAQDHAVHLSRGTEFYLYRIGCATPQLQHLRSAANSLPPAALRAHLARCATF